MKEYLQKYQYLQLSTRKKLSHTFLGNFKSAFKGNGMVFSDFKVREDGEDATSIDWLVSGREGKILTRRMEEDRSISVCFFFDISPTMDFGFGKTKFEMILEILCMLGLSTIEDGNRISAILFGGDQIEYVPFSKSRTGIFHLFKKVFQYSHKKNSYTIVDAIKMFQSMKLKKNLIFVLTDKTDIPEKYLKSLEVQNEVIYVNIFHSFENTLKLPENSTVRISLGNKGMYIDTYDKQKSSEFEILRKQKIQKFSKYLQSLGIDYFSIDESKEMFREFLLFMKKREARL